MSCGVLQVLLNLIQAVRLCFRIRLYDGTVMVLDVGS